MTTRPSRTAALAAPVLAALALAACTPSTPPSGVTTASVGEVTDGPTHTSSGHDGDPSPGASTATPTATDTPSAAPETRQVSLFYSTTPGEDCGNVLEVTREAPTGEDPLKQAMTLLLAGPTEEETAAGVATGFGETTAGKLRYAYIEASVAYVDMASFAAENSNWSASCGSQQLLAQLDSTVEANAPVEVQICYSFDGNLAAFYEWLQMSTPEYCDQAILDSVVGG